MRPRWAFVELGTTSEHAVLGISSVTCLCFRLAGSSFYRRVLLWSCVSSVLQYYMYKRQPCFQGYANERCASSPQCSTTVTGGWANELSKYSGYRSLKGFLSDMSRWILQ